MADVLAAVNVARREGGPVETRDVEPTPGGRRVTNEPRERSDDGEIIDAALVRRAALGDVTTAEALAESDGPSGSDG